MTKATRRWNGWGNINTNKKVTKQGEKLIHSVIGTTKPLTSATLKKVIKSVPKSTLPEALKNHALIDITEETRIRHARGQSFADWIAMHSGDFGTFPDGVAFPQSSEDVASLLMLAKTHDVIVIPYGGGTSVAGHINPQQNEQAKPILTIAMSAMNKLLDLDTQNQIATFGAGTAGPDLESQLKEKGYTLGHFPQSWELSTLGGWVASRSSGQQSLRYGRIEQLFAGGRIETPQGTLTIADIPASSAGPDLREMMMGTEGRAGIFTEVKVRVTPIAEDEQFMVVFLPNWEAGKKVLQLAVQRKIQLSMLRLSNADETRVHMKLGVTKAKFQLLENYLTLRGLDDNKCMLTFGVTGSKPQTAFALKQIKAIINQQSGVGGKLANIMGSIWAKGRFKFPYLRGTLWEKGIMVDTFETATNWTNIDQQMADMENAVKNALRDENEEVMAFTHLSHMYAQGASIYTSYFFRAADDYETTLARWKKIKQAASESVANGYCTISHQHGVGRDHAPYLVAEKTALGIQVTKDMITSLDPDGMMNPGVLLQD